MSDSMTLTYARHHGLAINHQANPSTSDLETLFQHDTSILCYDTTTNLQDVEADITNIIPQVPDFLADSKVKLTMSESYLLSSATAKPVFQNPFSNELWQRYLPNHRFDHSLKLREPLLLISGGDERKDLQGVKKGMDLALVLQDVRDQWKTDNMEEHARMKCENDEFVRELLEFRDTLLHQIRGEKLQVNREVLTLVGETLKREDMQDNMPNIYAEQLACARPKILTKSPTVLSIQDFESVANTGYTTGNIDRIDKKILAELSDPRLKGEKSMHKIDLLAAVTEATEAEDRFAQDNEHDQEWIDAAVAFSLPMEEERHADAGTDTRAMTPEPAFKRRKIAQDLKLSVPHCLSSLSTRKDTMSEHNSVGDSGIVSDLKSLLNADTCESDICNLNQECVDSFDQELVKLSDKALEDVDDVVASESLNPISALTKMRVPELPSLHWHTDLYGMGSGDLMDRCLGDQSRISPFGQEQELALNWTPFMMPSFKEMTRETSADVSIFLSKAIVKSEKVARSEQLLWKEFGLRILDDKEADREELELDSESVDCISVNGKVGEGDRMLSTEAAGQTASNDTCQHPHVVSQTLVAAHKQPNQNVINENPLMQSPAIASIRHLLPATKPPHDMLGFSASNSLSSFLDLRGKKFIKPKHVVDHIARESPEDPIQLTQESTVIDINNWDNSKDLNKTLPSSSDSSLPPTNPLIGSRTIVVNNRLLQSHPSLIPYLEHQHGFDLTIIYRDLDPRLENCPDLILSPKTAVMYANTQLLAQRPLPGQDSSGGLSPVHYRASKLAAGFDNVVVMLIQSSSLTNTTSFNDSIVVSKFVAFCDLLSTTGSQVRMLWLRHRQTKFLDDLINAWTCSYIAQYGLSNPTLIEGSQLVVNHDSFIQDETLWELFLRRAGMNPLAAQFVLGVLKRSDSSLHDHTKRSDDEHSILAWGLSHFVSMRPEDRLKLFGNALGMRSGTIISDVLDRHVQV